MSTEQQPQLTGTADFSDAWRRSAQSASTIHNVRNRLQSIIIEAAVLRRTGGVEPAVCDRIRNFAHEGAEFLEVFSQLLPSPVLSGQSTLAAAANRVEAEGVSPDAAIGEAVVACRTEAVETVLAVTFDELLPERGCRLVSAALVPAQSGRVALSLGLRRDEGFQVAAGRTPTWSLLQQMMRNLGGVVEFEERESPLLRLVFPLPRPVA